MAYSSRTQKRWTYEEARQKLEELIQKAKWKMNIGKWDEAERTLVALGNELMDIKLSDRRARDRLVKNKIKEIEALLKKCRNREKVEI